MTGNGERRARRPARLCAVAAAVLGLAALGAGAAPAVAQDAADASAADARYALVNGCYALRSRSTGRIVASGPDGGYRTTASSAADGERLRMQATGLGRYLLFGAQGDFIAAGGDDRAQSMRTAGAAAEWIVDTAGGAFTVSVPTTGKALAVAEGSQELVLVDADGAGEAARFDFVPANGCAEFPESEVNATGEPAKGESPFGEVRGLLDTHLHMMAFEFLGGRARCGRPWHPYGITVALVDCPDHEPGGAGAVLENAISCGGSCPTHDTDGWPTFEGWPRHRSLTHEQVYYKWMERAWRGGLRMFTNLLVDNAQLCEVYPYKRNSCNEMDGVRLQAARIRELEDYIDAQEGGPGKGWFRIVTSPSEARRVINDGKLAVVLGIEISKLFDCGVYNGRPDPGCDRASIDRMLDQIHGMGVRQIQLVNKFDNAFTGVAGDAGTTGVAVNAANFRETGRFWDFQTCDADNGPDVHDREQLEPGGALARDALAGGIYSTFVPGGTAPLYPDGPHCNTAGLTDLGEHAIRGAIERGMVFDPDHMSVRARAESLNVLEAEEYSGVISSHTWSTPDAYPRIYRLGGVITPYAGNSTSFVEEWQKTKPLRDERFYFGFGYGADTNGFGGQGAPRNGPNPVQYPFKSFDGAVTLDRQKTGTRTFDINTDGVAHYGLYPDWIEDLRRIAGDEIIEDMARGPEAYLQMWERAEGIPAQRCEPARLRLTRRGLGNVRLGADTETLLRRAGQPGVRGPRAWRYCVAQREGRRRGRITSVLTPQGAVGLVISTAPLHKAADVGTGDRAARVQDRTEAFGSGVGVRPAGGGAQYVYGIRDARIRFVAIASRAASRTPARLRGYLRRAGLR